MRVRVGDIGAIALCAPLDASRPRPNRETRLAAASAERRRKRRRGGVADAPDGADGADGSPAGASDEGARLGKIANSVSRPISLEKSDGSSGDAPAPAHWSDDGGPGSRFAAGRVDWGGEAVRFSVELAAAKRRFRRRRDAVPLRNFAAKCSELQTYANRDEIPRNYLGPPRERERGKTTPATLARYRLLDALRSNSLERTRDCRRKRRASSVQVLLVEGSRVATHGLITCGSVWGCPVCAAAIYAGRAAEITEAAARWRGGRVSRELAAEPPAAFRGYYLHMLTLTVRHTSAHRLEYMRRMLAEAHRMFWSGRGAKELRRRLGIVHWVRGLEVTWGEENGWHPHEHLLLFSELEHISRADWLWISERWRRCVRTKMGAEFEPSLSHGVDISPSHTTDYIAKLGLEIAQISSKEASSPDRYTPWRIARESAGGGVTAPRMRRLWREYTAAMKGARQLDWSHGAKRALGVREMSDRELACSEDAKPRASVLLAFFSAQAWDACRRVFPRWTSYVLTLALTDPAELAALAASATGPPNERAGPPEPAAGERAELCSRRKVKGGRAERSGPHGGASFAGALAEVRALDAEGIALLSAERARVAKAGRRA